MMRIRFLLCGTALMLSSVLHGQSVKQNAVTVSKTFPNGLHQSLFTAIPDLDSALVFLFRDQVESVKLFLKSGASRDQSVYDRFDPNFEGDQYYFKRKYKQSLQLLPDAEIDSIARMRKCEADYLITAYIYPDSVVYHFFQFCPPGELKVAQPRNHAFNATYKGGVVELKKHIEEGFQAEKYHMASDSVVLFNGIVNRDGSLSDLALVETERSKFSDFILNRLEQTGTSWLPNIQGGRLVRSVVRFYIRLNNDNTLVVSTS